MALRVRQLINDLGNPAANQIIVENGYGNRKTFVSYGTEIARKEKGVVTLGKNWDYSKTTMKHLYIFLRDECLLYVHSK